MRRCRKETDSFTFLKRKPLVSKTVPSQKCTTIQQKLLGIEMGGKKGKSSICSLEPGESRKGDCTCLHENLIQQIRSRSSPLFCATAQLGIPEIQRSPFTPDMLVSGFGLRNFASLRRAILAQQVQDKESVEEEYLGSETMTISTEKSTTSQTEISLSSGPSTTEDIEQKKKKLEYFMGITTAVEEGSIEEGVGEELKYIRYDEALSEEIYSGNTEAMRQAQKYIRTHKIFEFFQFLIAHLLSAIPDNPIEFLIELLEKCLIYRSGIGEPPLLYRRPHIDHLFYLMDRMKTGYIDLKQYSAGMKTLGICNFKSYPPTTKDGYIAKEYFIDEAYGKLTDQFHDMVKRHYLKYARPSMSQPPPTPQPTSKTWTGQFIFADSAVEEEEEVDQEKKFIEYCKATRKVSDDVHDSPFHCPMQNE